jgi:hypothetical protein
MADASGGWDRWGICAAWQNGNAPFAFAEVLGLVLSAWDSLCRRLSLGKGRVRVWARKMGCQGARFARRRSRLHPLTPQLAQEELSGGFKVSSARLEGVPSDLAKVKHRRSLGLLDHGAFLAE